MDACKKSILGWQLSDTRALGPCILTMHINFEKFKVSPNKALKLNADIHINTGSFLNINFLVYINYN